MPYVKQEVRSKLDEEIEALATILSRLSNDDPNSTAGVLNYTFTRLIMQVLENTGGIRYHKIASITGMLKNVSDEFYRRVAAKYEDDQILMNGDIPEYAKL
jgi:hypothetical protein